MSGYAIRRLLLIPPTLLIVMIMVFAMVALLPGDAVDAAGGRGVGGQSIESREAKRAALGLDRPLPIQLAAWLVGWNRNEGVVLASTDGGVNWAPVKEDVVHLFNALAFPSDRLGWGAGDGGGIYFSKDGGVSWTNQAPAAEERMLGIDFADKLAGWAVGEGGAIYHTANALDWVAQTSGTDAALGAIAAVSPQVAVAGGGGGAIVRTTDGGATWTRVESGTGGTIRAISFADETHGWAAGDGGALLATTDGGQTWTAQASGVSDALHAIATFDAATAWAAGANGAILATTDGGATWRKQNPSVNVAFSSISFVDATRGVAAGPGGTIVATEDGGATWRQREVNPLRPITRDLTAISFVNPSILYAAGWDTSFEWGLLGGNLGKSLLTSRLATTELRERVPRSLELMVLAMIIAVGLGVPIGVLAAIRQDTWIDYVARTIAVIGLSLPGFWFATLVILLPSIWFSWTPPLEFVAFTENPIENLKFFFIPSFIVGFGTMAAIMRMTRATMLETMRQDYIRTAWSKGLRESSVVIRHALKNAMIPVVTIIGIQVPFILGESVVIEFIFRVPGIGLLAWDSVTRRDFPMLQAVVLFVAFMYITMNLAVDLVYGWLDPRIRYA